MLYVINPDKCLFFAVLILTSLVAHFLKLLHNNLRNDIVQKLLVTVRTFAAKQQVYNCAAYIRQLSSQISSIFFRTFQELCVW